MCEFLEIAEPIQFGVPLGNLLAPREEWQPFCEAANEDSMVPFLRVLEMEGEGCVDHDWYWVAVCRRVEVRPYMYGIGVPRYRRSLGPINL